MLTRIEIDGFKTFRDFTLDLEPFQVIVGPNGVGKSNLFDAMQLLARLTEQNLWTAFQASRGEAGELFSLLPGGQPVNEMRFAVELLIEPRVRDEWGREEMLGDTRLRYELLIGRERDPEGQEHLQVKYESLKRVLVGEDEWLDRHPAAKERYFYHSKRGTPFISTDLDNGVKRTVALHQDGRKGRKRLFPAESMERTVLASVYTTEFPHVFAAREEMRQWRLLQLNPEVLRQPNPVRGPTKLSVNGDNLARTLARIERENKYILNDISRDLANLVPGLLSIEIEENRTKEVYVIYAQTQDGRRFSSRTLSDGTLRLLALITLANDPDYSGVLCFEEPENGVHPFRMSQMVDLLRSLSTRFSSDDEEAGWPLRQLLVNTHSPLLMAQLNDTELLFAYMPTRIDPTGDGTAAQVTRIVPVRGELLPDPEHRFFTRQQVEKYLHSADWDAAQRRLVGAITT